MKFDTIEEMEALGFQGSDASLNESLVEYGLAWMRDGDDWFFVYRHPYKEKRFDWARFLHTTDVFKEWDWALEGSNLDSFLSCFGTTLEDFSSLPYLFSHWGPLEIFGDSYSEGFKIKGLEW